MVIVKEAAKESSETKLFLCNLMLEWQVSRDAILKVSENFEASDKMTVRSKTHNTQDGGGGLRVASNIAMGMDDADHVNTVSGLTHNLCSSAANTVIRSIFSSRDSANSSWSRDTQPNI
jgi:hypothetical protein